MTLTLHKESTFLLKQSKNLLAFSGGLDSSALFFLLMEADIPFDMAIVDYQKRPQSALEVAYAKELGSQYKKSVYVKMAQAEERNFEASARKIRYDYFIELCHTYGYESVITAHQLNDRLEWFLMQFTKGAGLPELLGIDFIAREADYTLVRPMLAISRDEITDYLQHNSIRFFEDQTNQELNQTRNFFRHTFSQPLINAYRHGIEKSFTYLRSDADALHIAAPYRKIDALTLIQSRTALSDIREIDYHLKRAGYLLSSAQKEEITRTEDCVIGGKIAVVIADGVIYMAPYNNNPMSKKSKEAYRTEGIPPKIRPYLEGKSIALHAVLEARDFILNSTHIR